MENFTTGYCHDLNDQNDGVIAEFKSTIIPISVDGVEVSDTFFITCPWCNRNVMFLTTVSNYDMRCDKCGKGIWGAAAMDKKQWVNSLSDRECFFWLCLLSRAWEQKQRYKLRGKDKEDAAICIYYLQKRMKEICL